MIVASVLVAAAGLVGVPRGRVKLNFLWPPWGFRDPQSLIVDSPTDSVTFALQIRRDRKLYGEAPPAVAIPVPVPGRSTRHAVRDTPRRANP